MSGEDRAVRDDRWGQVVEDMTATADHYRAGGWRTLELHPGEVATRTPTDPEARFGLEVVVADEEFDALAGHATERTFDGYEVLRATADGVVFAVVVLQDVAGEVAVFVPVYYEIGDVAALREGVDRRGALFTHVRGRLDDEVVSFEHDDPEPFFPDPERDDEAHSAAAGDAATDGPAGDAPTDDPDDDDTTDRPDVG